MHIKPQITFRDIPHSDAVEDDIRKKIEKIEQYYAHLMRCDVVIEQVQKHKHNGKLYHPRIIVSVPGDTITINNANNEDVYIAIRDAFDALRRRLKTFAKKQRGEVKSHEQTITGRIVRLFKDEAFGFIEAQNDEYFFTNFNINNSRFDNLKVGLLVEFIPSEGNDGLLAHRINIIKRKIH